MIVYYAQPVYIYYKYLHVLYVDSPFLQILQSVIFFAEPVEVPSFLMVCCTLVMFCGEII